MCVFWISVVRPGGSDKVNSFQLGFNSMNGPLQLSTCPSYFFLCFAVMTSYLLVLVLLHLLSSPLLLQ